MRYVLSEKGWGSTGGQADGEAEQASGHGDLGWVNLKDAKIYQDQSLGRLVSSESVQNSNSDLAIEHIRIPGKWQR